MTATTPTTTTTTPSAHASLTATRRFPLLRAGLVAGVAAATTTTLLAALARAFDVPVAVGGEEIPLLGFAQMTLVGALLGVAIAKGCARRSHGARATFVGVTIALTALSIVPDLMADASTATRLVLVLTHLAAAAIVIPALARRLAR